MHAWSGTATIAAAMLIATEARADPFVQRAAVAPCVVGHDLADDNQSSSGGMLESDPTDDGSIIVECVGHGRRGALVENEYQEISNVRRFEVRLATIPRIPLDRAPCWSPDEKRVR
jgi:hypothetical protein